MPVDIRRRRGRFRSFRVGSIVSHTSVTMVSSVIRASKKDWELIVYGALVMKFFPRELWQTIQPSFKPDTSMDGYVPQVTRAGAKRGFEDEEEEEENLTKRRKGAGGGEDEDEGEGAGEGEIPDPEDEEADEEIVDSDFEDDDDEMGGDYNAEQYFDDGGDEYGDDGFGDGGGGGGEEDTF